MDRITAGTLQHATKDRSCPRRGSSLGSWSSPPPGWARSKPPRSPVSSGTAKGAELARRFTALVRPCSGGGRQEGRVPADPAAKFEAWLAETRACGTPAMATFAASLEQDGTAVRAALPCRRGQAEAQVNRLKLLKRQSHGRAGFDLLRRRALMAA